MQRKTLVFGLLGLMGVLVVLAYAAGQQSNRLSAEQTNFNGYQSENHAKRLTAQVWDATMNALTTWAKNHESRLQVHGSVPGYPDLTQEQLSFSNLLSTQHNNALTAQMRDGLLNKLTTTITNHEMRLRALENKPVVKNGSCVGERVITENWSCSQDYEKTNSKVGVYINLRERCYYYLTNSHPSWHHPDDFVSSDPYARRKCELKYMDKQWKLKTTEPSYSFLPFESRGLYDGDWKALLGCSTAWQTNNSCAVWCSDLSENSCTGSKWCKWTQGGQRRGPCSSFDKYECWKKASLGCTWKQ